MNPLLIALDKELARFKNSIESRVADKEISAYVNKLCALWNSYEGRVKDDVYGEKILELGDFLFSLKCYRLASNHCYGRYLYSKFGNFLDVITDQNENSLLETFFPDVNNNLEVINTIRALIGYSSSASLSLIHQDVMFQNADTPHDVANLLKLLQLAMQIGLKKDSYCWLVYNGTIHLYTICRIFITHGFSTYILRYLLWACVCMESSVPLMTVKYFSWRSQLYTLTCECYYDLKADAEAEKFAHRGLQKVEELKDIEKISSSVATPESTFMFNQAAIKLNIMVFKRQVFENKRRAKGVLRSKLKPILKDILHSQWPRTSTERLLAETFRSRASQFLAVVESLANSNRRLVQTSLGAPENDDCLDAYLELFFAGVELLAGGGGPKPSTPGKHDLSITEAINGIPLINLAASESQSISLESSIRFVKLSYNYENWETFDLLISPLMEELNKYPEDNVCVMELKLLNLISAMSTINYSRIKKKMIILRNDESESLQVSQKYKPEHIEHLLSAATMLNSYVKDKVFIAKYHDVLVDIVVIFWNKCRKYFARITSSLFEGNKYSDKLFLQWLKVLTITQKLMITLNVNDIDICACAEASLKLSVILECIAVHGIVTRETSAAVGDRMNVPMFQVEYSVKSCNTPHEEARESQLIGYFKDICAFLEITEKPISLLEYVSEMLNSALNSIISARDNMLKPHSQIADDSFMSHNNGETEDTYTLNMEAYHLEVTYQHYHIISLISSRKLSEIDQTQVKKKGQEQKKYAQKQSSDQSKELGRLMTGKNDLLKALYLLSSAEVEGKIKMKENIQHLEEAFVYIQKAIQVESKIRSDNVTKKEVKQAVPPTPLLLNRGSSWMVLKPAPFKPKGGETIRWYCLYLRNAAGNNVKVRLNDTKYNGTGEEVPYNSNCTFTVKGLEPNERYVAAVAAYDKNGKLIGNSIGESSRPFLAAHVLPCLLAYAKLCRVAFNKNVWRLSKMAFNMLWDHYVEIEIEDTPNVKSSSEVYKLHPYRLKDKNVANSSPVMLRFFIESIFINLDIAVKEGALFCDSLCDNGPMTDGQISRLNECEKLLIAIEVCGWLNDNMLCLQAVVFTYGLLAPIIHWKLPIIAVLKVLLHIHCVLQEIQIMFKNKKQNSTTESLRHMVCCLAYYVAKILVHFNKKHEAIEVLESCSKLIVQMNPPDTLKTKTQPNIPDDDTVSLSGKKTTKKTKMRVKTKAGMLKSLSEMLPGNLLEIRALEIYTLKLQRQVMTDCNNELTGNEDVVIMNAVVSSLPIPQAYKEVVKFKRKAQFFEAFVGILGRALNEGSYENLLEWVRETIGWLTKRNEIILNKTSNDPKGVVVVASNTEVEKLKRYSTAVVEYGHSSSVTSTNTGKVDVDAKKSEVHVGGGSTHGSVYGGSKHVMDSHSKQLMPINEGSETGFSNVTPKDTKTHRSLDDKKGTTEEKRNKEAGMKLQGMLSEIWKIMQRRRKMRNVCFEELPWRCQMNLISAECHFQMCLTAFENIAKQNGCPDLKKEESMMDVNWFTLSTSGAMIVSWAGCMKTYEKSLEPIVDIGGVTIDHKPEVHIIPSVSKHTISLKVEKKTSMGKNPSSHRSEEHRKEEVLKHFLQHLEQVYLYYQRAIVLSHRGRNWILLQQACNKLLNTTHKLMVKIMLLNSNIDTTTYDIPYKLSQLRTIIYDPFYMAAEFLLECMNDIGNQWMPESEMEVYGNIHKNKGGCCLIYDFFDCNSYIDYGNIKRVIMFAIEVLLYEHKWERVISIILKLNAVSLGHFSESLLPLLVVSQRCLLERLTENESALNFHPSIIFDQNTGVPIDINLVPIPPEPIEVGAHIDPIGHNLYEIPASGSKYSIVPFEYETTHVKLKHVADGRSLYSRMLEHSRKLCLAYLASKQGKKHIEGKFQRIDSAVSFVATQVKPPLVTPLDYKNETLELFEDIETHPLSNKLLSVVISSYENTIEVLKKNKEFDLAAQAMHELGNIMFHCNNVKASFKWWSYALDTILRLTNGLKMWRSLIDSENNTLKSYKPLLDKCGIWGCMLGGLLATKVARYIHFAHIDMCCDACHLAAAFFKALFSASLVHPSSCHSYTDYDIGVNNSITQIIPGLNIFTDDHRIHCSNLTDCAIWLSEHLIKFGFYLEVQPLLSFAQYLSFTICEDVSSLTEVRLLRIESLCHLNMFSCAIKYFSQIISGTDVPNICDSTKLRISPRLHNFNDSLLISDERNVSIINELCLVTLKDFHYNTYGTYLCNKILHMQANLLVSMAKVIYEIPIIDDKFKKATVVERQSIVEETIKGNRKISQWQKALNSFDEKAGEDGTKTTHRMSMFQKPAVIEEMKVNTIVEELSQCGRKLKGSMLQYAECIIKEGVSNGQKSLSNSQDLEMYVRNNILLSKIAYEKLLTLSAAHHVHTCLLALSNTNIPNDVDDDSEENVSKEIKLSKNMDISVWLLCRQLLCFYLLNEDNVMERMDASSNYFIDNVGSIEENINDAIMECDMFNDQATRFIFQMMLIDIDVKNGKHTTDVLKNLKNLEDAISVMPEKSYITKRVLFDSMKLSADLKALKEANAKKSIIDYKKVEHLILDELCFHGYDVDMDTWFPVLEQTNVNNALFEDLMCVKVCRHRSSALATAVSQDTEDEWTGILVEVNRLFDIMEKVTIKLPLLKIELLLLKGEIQRHLFKSGNCNINVCVKTLLEVIQLSSIFTCDFSTIRQCYLEISTILFSNLKVKEREWNKDRMTDASTTSLTPEVPTTTTTKQRRKSSVYAKQIRKPPVSEKVASKEINRLGKGIWICIRAASIIAKAQQKTELLAGEVSMTSDSIVGQHKCLPLFALEDIMGMTNAEQIKHHSPLLDNNTNRTYVEVTWSLLLNYATQLRRSCSYSSLVIGENKVLIVRIPRKCHMRALKLSEVCKYLESNCDVYQEHCMSVLPMESISSILKLTYSATRSETAFEEIPNTYSKFSELSGSASAPCNLPSQTDATIDGVSSGIESPKPNTSNEKPNLKINNPLNPEKAKEFEIAVQWYLPELDNPQNNKIHLFFASNNKNVVAKSPSAQFSQMTHVRHFSVNTADVFALHECVVHLMEEEEAALALQGEQSYSITPISPTSKSPSRKKPLSPKARPPSKTTSQAKTNTKRASSLKLEKEDECKKKLSSIASMLTSLLAESSSPSSSDEDTQVDIPFDSNWSNIVSLASWLNPSFGHITKTSETLFNWMSDMFGIPSNM